MDVLEEVYKRHEDGLNAMYAELEKNDLYDGCSYPLLLSTWEREAMPKVMFFGQETNGWGDSDTIEGLMIDYIKFDLGVNYPSLFWRYLWSMSDILKLTGDHPFLWNNVNKFGKVDSKGRPEDKVTELENKYFNVLVEELDAVKPEVCVFFTGPNYDEDIKAKLPDVEFLSVEEYGIRKFARLKSRHLPENSFRIYHPGYGNRYSEWYREVMNKIAAMCKKD